MRPTDILVDEHNAIEEMLEVLEAVCEKIVSREDFDQNDIPKILRFFSEFADGCHHAKEEDLLFPAMAMTGIPREDGPIGVMLSEHEFGRYCMKGMRESFAQFSQGADKARELFVSHARRYISMLTQHIQKENHILFPLANQRLSPGQQQILEEQFRRVENTTGAAIHSEFLAMLSGFKLVYLKQKELSHS